MTSIARTTRQAALSADQLLESNWNYTGAILLESQALERQAQHRVLTQWRDEQGKELCFILNFIAAEHQGSKVVMPSSQCRPEIDRRARVLDRYGFEIHRSSRQALQWDLLMRLDLDSVSSDLQQRLVTH